MPAQPTPLNNHCLIEVIDEYSDVSRFEGDDPLNTNASNVGRLIKGTIDPYVITVSSASKLDVEYRSALLDRLSSYKGKTVRWEEMAETGRFESDGKKYVLVPWWRLISVEEDN